MATGGLAYAAAPLIGLAAGTIGAYALAGAVGGFFAGGIGSAMSGGSFWHGALIGFVGGAVGGGVFGYLGGPIWERVLAAGFAGGFTSGMVGGSGFKNALAGGVASAVIALTVYGTAQGATKIAKDTWEGLKTLQIDEARSTTAMDLDEFRLRQAPVNVQDLHGGDFYGDRPQYVGTLDDGTHVVRSVGTGSVSEFWNDKLGYELTNRASGEIGNQGGTIFKYNAGIPNRLDVYYKDNVVERIYFGPK